MQGEQLKMINRCLETFLQCFIADQPKTWVLWLPWAEYWYNITFHVYTGTTPFLYGQKPQMLILFLIGETKVEAVQRDLLDKDEALRPVKYHLQRHQCRMKSYVDRKRTEKVFEIGDWNFLKLRSQGQQTVEAGIWPKLAPCYYGLYQVIERIGVVAYKV